MPNVIPRLALFDLDGTLIDSQPGIFHSLTHAFTEIGASLPDHSVLREWIGPPFHQSFPSVLGDDAERIELAIEKYRDHYEAHGWAGHAAYPGIAELIDRLVCAQCRLAVVTTKILPQARKIVAHLPFGTHFERVYAAEPGTKHSAKAEMIASALSDFSIDAADTVMIGDRKFDIEGALANQVRAIGVSWGFGTVDELRAAGAQQIVNTPSELAQLLVLKIGAGQPVNNARSISG